MFAVVRTGGKQYRVAPGDKIVVEKMDGEAGDTVTLGDVLLAGDGSDLKKTDGLTVSAEIIAQAKGEKVTVFKKRRRHNYRRKKGHRQQHTILRITAIGDEKAAPKKSESKAAPKKAEKAPDEAKKAAAPSKTAGADVAAAGESVESKPKSAKKGAPAKAKSESTKNAAPAKGAAKKPASKSKK